MKRQLIAALSIVAVTASALVVGPLGSVATAGPCDNKKAPVIIDDEGDATGFVVQDVTPTSDPGLDILEGRLKYNKKKQVVTFDIKVLDLSAVPTAEGKYFRFNFQTGGFSYAIIVRSDEILGSRTYSLSILGDTLYESIADLEGEFLVGKNIITVDMPLKVFNAAGKAYIEAAGGTPPKPAKTGSSLGGFELLGQRFYGPGPSFTPTADEALGECIYVLGKGVTG